MPRTLAWSRRRGGRAGVQAADAGRAMDDAAGPTAAATAVARRDRRDHGCGRVARPARAAGGGLDRARLGAAPRDLGVARLAVVAGSTVGDRDVARAAAAAAV